MRHLIACVMFVSIGCGGNDVSVSGNDPVADAEEAVDAICEWESDCGNWSIDCTSSSTGMLDCTATKETVSFAECRMEELPEAVEAFQCAGTLSSSEVRLVNTCLNKLLDRPCVTQAQMDAYIAALERGEEPMSPGGEEPAECDALEPIFERCQMPRTVESTFRLGNELGLRR